MTTTLDRRTLLKAGAALAGITPVLRTGAGHAASDPAVIDAARKEGAVSLYSSASTGPCSNSS